MKTEIDSAIELWLQGPYDEKSKEEIRRLQKEDPEKLQEAFYTHLSFGTGGLRGVMGVGTNRINTYTVGFATQGLSNYLLKQKKGPISVLIGYDTRLHSKEFAEEAASIFAANGIQVYLYSSFRPVALLSFGIVHLGADAGVMITASHNPPKYNGYKVWWKNGAQVLPPHDRGIIDEVGLITSPEMVKKIALPNPLVKVVDEEIDRAYFKAISPLQLHPGICKTHGKELSIVYTSLHGGGISMIPRAMKEWGFTHLSLVEEQCIPDGHFPTVKSPNPEEPETLKMGVEALLQQKGDLLLATDPDVDRLAVVVPHEGKPFLFNGNEIACLGLEFLLRSLKEELEIPQKAIVVKTIVTSELFKAIAEHYHIDCIDVLTGFKYIGEKIAFWEEEREKKLTPYHHFLFGAEESYGFLLGTHARDKDAVVAALLMAEAALILKREGKTLVDLLYEIYAREGVFREKLFSLTFEGMEGKEKMQRVMDGLRQNPPTHIGESIVVEMEDYQNRVKIHLESGHKEPLTLPESNVLRFFLQDHTKLVIRPSGTEPKIKIYCGVTEKHHRHSKEEIDKAIKKADLKIEEILSAFKKAYLK